MHISHFLFVPVGLFTLLQLGGCVVTDPVIVRADTTMKHSNPMHEIAIVTAARVIFPRMDFRTLGGADDSNTKEPVTSLAHSKKAAEIAASNIKHIFEQKGYRVVYAQPVGVGYKWPPYRLNWVYTFDTEEEKKLGRDKFQVLNSAPVYEYESTASNPAFRAAVRQVFETINNLDSQRNSYSVIPSQASVATIAQMTGSDTVCVVNVWGQMHTTGRKIAHGLVTTMQIIFNKGTHPRLLDWVETNVICSQVASGKVLWHHWYREYIDPTDPSAEYYIDLLKELPNVDKLLKSSCKLANKRLSTYDCTMDSIPTE